MARTIKREVDMGGHLDPDTLGAFFEKSLTERALSDMFGHLATCERCRDWLEVYAESGAGRRLAVKPQRRARDWFGSNNDYPNMAAGVACAVLFAGLMTFLARRPVQHTVAELAVTRSAASMPATSWLFAQDLGTASPSHMPILPAAFTAVRLEGQLSFVKQPRNRRDRRRLSSYILVETALGTRRISLSLTLERGLVLNPVI